MDVKISIGLRNNQLVHIADVDRGLDCKCVCLECGGRLSAKKGDVNEHHFAHYNQSHILDCLGGVETALHKYAKQTIEKAGYLELPAFKVSLPYPDNTYMVEIPARKAVFNKVEIEERVFFGRRRIDVIGYELEKRMLIEIFVSHRVKGKKLEEVKVATESIIEIQIQRGVMFPNGVLDTASLDKLILDSRNNKRWLHHPDAEKLINQLQKQALELKLKQRQLEKENFDAKAKRLAEASANAPRIEAYSKVQIDKPSDRRQGHVPSRQNVSEVEYVQAIYDFLSYEPPEKRAYFIQVFKKMGNISIQDVEVAEKLGLIF